MRVQVPPRVLLKIEKISFLLSTTEAHGLVDFFRQEKIQVDSFTVFFIETLCFTKKSNASLTKPIFPKAKPFPTFTEKTKTPWK